MLVHFVLLIEDSIGTFIGYFFLMVQFSQVFGNLLSSFVLVDSVSSRDTLMYIFIGLCGFSVFIIFFLREEQSLVTPTETSLFQKVSHVFLLLKDKKMLLIIPSFASCGCVQSFLFGIFTAEIVKPSLGTGQIGFAMSAYGITTLFCFLIFGKFGDRFGHFYVSLIGFFVNIFLLVMYFFITNIYSTSWLGRHSFIVYASAALFGVGDSALYLFIKVMMSSLYTDNVEPAYALLQFFKALAMAITFAIGPYLSLATKINLFLCVNLFGLFCILFLELFVIPSSNNLTVDNNSETEDFSLVHRSIEGDVNVEAIEEKD